MKKNYLNTDALTACEMIEVSDQNILEWSNGEVKSAELFNEDESINTSDETLFSKKIFGNPTEETVKMGHISLPLPVVNPQYVRGKMPVLPNLVGMDRKDIEDIIHYSAYYNTTTKAVIPAKEVNADNNDCSFTGGTGIEKIMMDKGISTDNIILHTLPVIPAALRITKINCPKNDGAFRISCVNSLYVRVLNRVNRLEKLSNLGTPEIILLNEKRMLEESVAALIGNGMYAIPFTSPSGFVYLSLDDVAESIKRVFYKYDTEDYVSKCLEDSGIIPDVLWGKIKKSCEMVKRFNKEFWSKFNEKEGVSGEVYDNHPITIAFKEKHDPIEKDIYSDIYKIVSEVFDQMFGDYSEYKDQFVISAENAIDTYFDDIHENMEEHIKNCSADEFCKHIAFVAYYNMRNMKKKRVQWIDFDTYTLRRLED